MTTRIEIAPGVIHHPGWLDRPAQEALVGALRDIARVAPFFVPRMPKTGTPFSVKMTNCGVLGWVSDLKGYRYQPHHPETGEPWPQMPDALIEAWQALADYPHPPEACLINFYESAAKMGLHQDRDEADLDAPVLSLSLGDTGVFRVGGITRGGPTRSVKLQSGDALSFGGPARLAFHGIDRIMPGTSSLLPQGGRINLTMRRVTKAG
jgi:alkylated DNA repair protein (DNA oxidative demethylase)